jgi:hypothetical protein
MTCIVGVLDKKAKTVWIGGDSAGVSHYNITPRKDAKVFRNGDFLFGFTSSFRMGQLLRYRFKPPEHKAGLGTERYMTTDFIDAVRKCLRQHGYATVNNNVETGGSFLVGYRGRLFAIHDDYQVGESLHGYDAVGCGENYAKGALAATADLAPRERVQKALEVAALHSAGVCKPFVVRSI